MEFDSPHPIFYMSHVLKTQQSFENHGEAP